MRLRLDLDEGWLQIALQWLQERGGSRSTKPCFSCQVAAAGVKGTSSVRDGCSCGRFVRELFLLCVLQRVVVSVCVVLCGS